MQLPRLLVVGATGFLGRHVLAAARGRFEVVTAARSNADLQVDLADPDAARRAAALVDAEAVLFLAAMSRMADCEQRPHVAQAVNAVAPGLFAARFGSRMLYVSTDLVFDGRAAPYGPLAAPSPLSAYGCSKAEGEQRTLDAGGRVARLPLLFGRDDRGRGASQMVLDAIAQGRPLQLFTNEYRTPLHARCAAASLLALAGNASPRIVHLGGPERLSRWELAQRLCARHGLPRTLLSAAECQDPTRPRDVSLAGSLPQPPLDEMLGDC